MVGWLDLLLEIVEGGATWLGWHLSGSILIIDGMVSAGGCWLLVNGSWGRIE